MTETKSLPREEVKRIAESLGNLKFAYRQMQARVALDHEEKRQLRLAAKSAIEFISISYRYTHCFDQKQCDGKDFSCSRCQAARIVAKLEAALNFKPEPVLKPPEETL